ncbi:preprotein translocase subunit SecG [Clostridium septicum]|uniref:Protein-export membrane protein SecG n=1 Tax=Clostridium septicum TaxID=1504 RepID=A0A9N7JJJ8_CLOSE|nr:preprotein translocase subunit SecG [Clostridium septicum]AYE33663.1 preprotein translocase subunit SecG [Clostridium septicum]MDU1314836.1 preprotein translocase subunit SecG [Clostridium septicum]QAS61825.1 preprotein translocase subunit SecG [Clostridium septicum]UEC21726.1 preprotein translocase subunit SecG [Clostridium septicum]USS00222.1 preprotein translocase subunit SecG [Clostridium septicum]
MKNFLFILEAVLGLLIIVSVLLQPSKADALSGLIQGSKTETFFSKNKARTKEAMLVKLTIISAAAFAINTIALNLI